jgi:hypothetical protein
MGRVEFADIAPVLEHLGLVAASNTRPELRQILPSLHLALE